MEGSFIFLGGESQGEKLLNVHHSPWQTDLAAAWEKDTRQQGTETLNNTSSHSLLRFTTFVLPNLLYYK